MENLFRLDASAVFETKISQILHGLRFSDERKFEELISALSKAPKKKITRHKIKVFFAGHVAFTSAMFQERLTEPEIRALFDAIARDEGGGEIDTDLPESPEAFAKAINREIPFWIEAHRSDKK